MDRSVGWNDSQTVLRQEWVESGRQRGGLFFGFERR